jgi:hypothetical protein
MRSLLSRGGSSASQRETMHANAFATHPQHEKASDGCDEGQLRYRRQIHAAAAIIPNEPNRPSVASPRFADAGAGDGVGVNVGSAVGLGDSVVTIDDALGAGVNVRRGVSVGLSVGFGVLVGFGDDVTSGHVRFGMHVGVVAVGLGVGVGVGQSTLGMHCGVGDCAITAKWPASSAVMTSINRNIERVLI